CLGVHGRLRGVRCDPDADHRQRRRRSHPVDQSRPPLPSQLTRTDQGGDATSERMNTALRLIPTVSVHETASGFVALEEFREGWTAFCSTDRRCHVHGVWLETVDDFLDLADTITERL